MLQLNIDKIKDLIVNNKDKIILRNDTPEINLELALLLLDEVYNQLYEQKYRLIEDIQFTVLADNYLVLKFSLDIYNDKNILIARYVEIGEARENNDLVARYAYSRAIKRLVEKILGLRIINKVLLELKEKGELVNNNQIQITEQNKIKIDNNVFNFNQINQINEKLITEKQIQLIFELAKERNKLSDLLSLIKSLFNKNDIKELTSKEASKLIELLIQT